MTVRGLEDDGDAGDHGTVVTFDDPAVTLDIGGRLFKTHRSTLTAQSGYFRTMFDTRYHFAEASNGKSGNQTGRDVPIFIDRNPEAFHHILEFLRDPGYALPHTLERELEWYQIKSPWVSGEVYPPALSINDKAWMAAAETQPTFTLDTVEQWLRNRVSPLGMSGCLIPLLAMGASEQLHAFFSKRPTPLQSTRVTEQGNASLALPSALVRSSHVAPWRGQSTSTTTGHTYATHCNGHPQQVTFLLPTTQMDALQRVTWVFPCADNVPAGVYRYTAWKLIILKANGNTLCQITPEFMRMLDVLQYTSGQRDYRDDLEQSSGEIHIRLPLWFDPDLYGSYSSLAKSAGTCEGSSYLSGAARQTNLEVHVTWASHSTPEGASSGSLGTWIPPSYVRTQGHCMVAFERTFVGRLTPTNVHMSFWAQESQRLSTGSWEGSVQLSNNCNFSTDMLFCVVDDVTGKFLPVRSYVVTMEGQINVAQTTLALRHQQLAAWGSTQSEHVYHHSWDQSAICGRGIDSTLAVTLTEPTVRPCTLYVCQMQHSIGRYSDDQFFCVIVP